jgi:hypothetical protein
MARQPPIWQREGYRSAYARRKARGDRSASGTPGATRARRAKGLEAAPPPGRRRGHWSAPTPGGTRDLQTRGRKRLVDELKRLRAEERRTGKGTDVLIGVQGEVTEYTGKRRRNDPWTYTGRMSADDVLGQIEAAGGDVDRAIADILGLSGTEVERIDDYYIKEMGS